VSWVVIWVLKSDHDEVAERRLSAAEAIRLLEVEGVAEQWEALQAAEQARQQERDRRTAAERALQAAQAAQQQERDQRTAAERALQEAQAAQQQAEHVQETAALLEQERRAQSLGSMPSAPAPVPTGFASARTVAQQLTVDTPALAVAPSIALDPVQTQLAPAPVHSA
jgi:chromosome segregation ATPase